MNRALIFLSLCILSDLVSGQSQYWTFQSPYEIPFRKEMITGSVSVITFFSGKYIENNENTPSFRIGSFTNEEIDNINFIDRGFAGRWDIKAQEAGKIFLKASHIGAFTGLAILPGNLKARGELFLIYFEGILLTQGLTSFVKGMTDRYRPFLYMTPDQIDHLEGKSREEFLEAVTGRDIEDSFFSGDAASAAYSYIFLAKAFADYFPESDWRYAIWGLSVTGTFLTAYFRAGSGMHFPTDVIIGSLVGGTIGFLLPVIHKKGQSERLSIYSRNGGLTLAFRF